MLHRQLTFQEANVDEAARRDGKNSNGLVAYPSLQGAAALQQEALDGMADKGKPSLAKVLRYEASMHRVINICYSSCNLQAFT